jgi:hypothetical protein
MIVAEAEELEEGQVAQALELLADFVADAEFHKRRYKHA